MVSCRRLFISFTHDLFQVIESVYQLHGADSSRAVRDIRASLLDTLV